MLQNPLALLDATSLDAERDLWPFVANAPSGSMALTYHPDHRWVYFPRMQTSELLLFMGQKTPAEARGPVGSGAGGPPGTGRNAPHVSFTDTSAPAGAPGRRSVETRVIAAFRKEGRNRLEAKL